MLFSNGGKPFLNFSVPLLYKVTEIIQNLLVHLYEQAVTCRFYHVVPQEVILELTEKCSRCECEILNAEWGCTIYGEGGKGVGGRNVTWHRKTEGGMWNEESV